MSQFKTQVQLATCSPDQLRKIIESMSAEADNLRRINRVLLCLHEDNINLKKENLSLQTRINELSQQFDQMYRQYDELKVQVAKSKLLDQSEVQKACLAAQKITEAEEGICDSETKEEANG